ncbi:MAG: hypothetical protein Q8O37_08345 [Sulfuricellaceae bacterium]|nr:hypothetical protein [Sulfuricellaceae bacterium]
MTKPLSVLSLLMFFPAGGMAENWHGLTYNDSFRLEAREPVMEPGKGDKAGEPSSQKKDRKLTIWDRTTHTRPQQANPGDFFYQSSQTLTSINCTTRAFKPLQKVYYSPEGIEIKSVRLDEAEIINTLVPDSPIEYIFNYACTFTAPRAKPVGAPVSVAKPIPEPVSDASKSPSPPKEKPAEDKPAASNTPPTKKLSAETPAKK